MGVRDIMEKEDRTAFGVYFELTDNHQTTSLPHSEKKLDHREGQHDDICYSLGKATENFQVDRIKELGAGPKCIPKFQYRMCSQTTLCRVGCAILKLNLKFDIGSLPQEQEGLTYKYT